MNAVASQLTSRRIYYWIIYSGVDQRKHQSPASPAFARGIHRWPVNSPQKRLVTRKMFPFDDARSALLVLSHLDETQMRALRFVHDNYASDYHEFTEHNWCTWGENYGIEVYCDWVNGRKPKYLNVLFTIKKCKCDLLDEFFIDMG